MSSGLRALPIHLAKVSLGKALVSMAAMLRLVGTRYMYVDVSFLQVILKPFDLQVDMLGS